MAVLVEGISVVVRCSAIIATYQGGISAFTQDVPNGTLCADGELVRVGFMTPVEARSYVQLLESRGLQYHDGNGSLDLVVVDQRTGFRAPCLWAEFGQTDWNNNPQHPIAVCRAKPSHVDKVVAPNGWNFENSLSAEYRFVEVGELPESLKLVRRERDVDVFVDRETGEEFFVHHGLNSK